MARDRITVILPRSAVLVSEFHATCNLSMTALIIPGFVLGLDRGPCDIFLNDNVIAGSLLAHPCAILGVNSMIDIYG